MITNRALLSISSDGLISPKIIFRPTQLAGEVTPFGWGVGWYPNDQKAGVIHKEPAERATRVSTDDTMDWSKFRSSCFLSKVKGQASGYTFHETQPFSRSFAGSEWLFTHSGSLDKQGIEKLCEATSRFLEPLGKTDSELTFCYLLGKIQETDARSLRELDPKELMRWLSALDLLGGADCMLTDGTTTMTYYGQSSDEKLYFRRVAPPQEHESLESELISLSFEDPRDAYRTMVIVSSERFLSGEWVEMQPGQLLMTSYGAIVWDSHQQTQVVEDSSVPTQPKQAEQVVTQDFSPVQTEQSQTNHTITNVRSLTKAADGTKLSYRLFDISHTTEYSYTEPVLHSTHWFRLQPQECTNQGLEYSEISISSPGEQMQFEDVFGNQSLHYTIRDPYTKLRVENRSRVKIFAKPIDDVSLIKRQSTIPLLWMPWQRQMMTPYLLPQELPDTQLEELMSYAMSFVERNDYHLLDTLKDINLTIYKDFRYQPGNTTIDTTPFEVYTKRIGVCQDFANIFICLARLLGVPARYQMGYIYTGANYENKIQSDASHAWVELYLPYIGWRGFDPTNGCLVGQDHISVARGRNYRDATPTSGTLFKGGGKESLSVEVQVQEV